MDHRAIMQGVIVRVALSVFGLLTIALFLLGLINDKGALAVHAQAVKLESLQKENQSLEVENKTLAKEIDSLQSDPAAIEKIAREKLNLVRPGEIILVLPNETAPAQK